jgi:hypothetical protein
MFFFPGWTLSGDSRQLIIHGDLGTAVKKRLDGFKQGIFSGIK